MATASVVLRHLILDCSFYSGDHFTVVHGEVQRCGDDACGVSHDKAGLKGQTERCHYWGGVEVAGLRPLVDLGVNHGPWFRSDSHC